MIERHKIIDREQWLGLRDPDVTASVMGALFGVHPYKTPLRLYAEKRGTEFAEPDDNAILRRGRKLESVVAKDVIDQRQQWLVVKADEYLRNPELRIGATPDYYVANGDMRTGVLQIKTAMPHIIERDWKGGTEPPLWILLQASTEMMLADAAFAAVAVMNVGDYETTIFEIPRNLAVEAKIILAVGEFWKRVELGVEPEPDFGRDRDVLRALHPKGEPGKVVDLRDSNAIAAALADRARMKAENKANDEAVEKIETDLIYRMTDAETALVEGFRVTYKTVAVDGYTVKPRNGRQLRILDRREKGA